MKYLNAVLTVIAVCLVLITSAVTGILPAAHANENKGRYVSVPLNEDGSMNVKLINGVVDVNIEEINGSSVWGQKLPVDFNNTVDINLAKINGSSFFTPIEVRVQK